MYITIYMRIKNPLSLYIASKEFVKLTTSLHSIGKQSQSIQAS